MDMLIVNQTKGKLLAKQIILAKTFLTRLKGLLGRHSLPKGQALSLHPCSSVHTYFMKFTIDVVFLNQNGKVVYLQENLKPWRFTPFIKEAVTVVELTAGVIKESNTQVGDIIVFSETPHGGADNV